MCSKYPVKNFISIHCQIKRFRPYFELLYFRHGKAVWSLKLSSLYSRRGHLLYFNLKVWSIYKVETGASV